MNLRDKVQSYRGYTDIGDHKNARNEEMQFGIEVNELINRLNQIYEKLKSEFATKISDNNTNVQVDNIGDIGIQATKFQDNKSLEYHFKSLDIYKELDDKANVGYTLASIGDIHMSLGNIEKALDNYNQSLKCYENIGDRKSVAIMYGIIARSHKEMGNTEKTMEYIERLYP